MTNDLQVLAATKTRLMIVEDDLAVAKLIKNTAGGLGFEVTHVDDGAKVLAEVTSFTPDVIMLDFVMPGLDAIEILRALANLDCQAHIILMSGMDQRTISSVRKFADEKKLKVAGQLQKPFNLNDLESLLQSLNGKDAKAACASRSGLFDDFGLRMTFEPKFALAEDQQGQDRWFAGLSWSRDDGLVLSHDMLLKLAMEQQSTRGFMAFFLAELTRAIDPWKGKGIQPQLIVQIPPSLLDEESLPEHLAQIFNENTVPSHLVTLEISESVAVPGSRIVNEVLPRLKFKNFGIAIHCDINSESVLGLINDLPVDELVVDMRNYRKGSFAPLMEEEFQYSSLAAMAVKRKLRASAKNVNDSSSLEFVKRCGFSHARGFGLRPPVPAWDFINHFEPRV